MAHNMTSKNEKTVDKKSTKIGAKRKSVRDEFSLETDNYNIDLNNEPKKHKDNRFYLVVGIVIVVLVAIIVAIVVITFKPSMHRPMVEKIVTKDELKDKLNVDIKEPVDGGEVVFGIENDSIAKISYKKIVSDDREMNFILRTSSSVEDIENSIGLDVEFAYTPIMMTVVCDDESEVPVEARVALDEDTEEMRYMKALWYDNDKYYSMVTDNLVTREDFLQEVNRFIIANHVEF